MDSEGELPLDISEFRCTSVDVTGVVVVFDQTNRRYTYQWNDDSLAIARPLIEGVADPHPPEIIDCLARAVAFKAAKDVLGNQKPWQWLAGLRGETIPPLLKQRAWDVDRR